MVPFSSECLGQLALQQEVGLPLSNIELETKSNGRGESDREKLRITDTLVRHFQTHNSHNIQYKLC